MTRHAPANPPGEPDSAASRLEGYLRANACIVYHEDLPDREYAYVKCSIYGVPNTNELFVRMSNGKVSFVAVAPSPVEFPLMADRIFGLDAADHAVAFGLADKLWEQNRTVLIARHGR